jgi:8-oxo-dGTP pyrophosphatase MutT (NUDIX family)
MRLALDRLAAGQLSTIEDDPGRDAAVLVPIIERDDGSWLLFTERAAHLPTHAGEMSFPGGRHEQVDGSLRDTALREAAEEIGLDPAEADPIGRLDDIGAPHGGRVRPYVARVPDRGYDPDPSEVSEVVRLPAQALLDRTNYSAEHHPGMEGPAETLPYFRVDGTVVWGLTGYLTGRLLQETADWSPPPGHPLEHPGATRD